MAWDGWTTILHDDKANKVHYELVRGAGFQAPGVFQIQDDVIFFGTDATLQAGPGRAVFESYLRLNLKRYRDIEVTVKVEFVRTAKTDGVNEDQSHWFGIATRALRPGFWDAYLFYLRRDGRVEFGLRGDIDEKPGAQAVRSRPVVFRVMADGNHIQSWVDDDQYHDRRDKEGEFVRKGDIYLVSYGSLVKIHEVRVRRKQWYAPITRFLNTPLKVIVAIITFVSAVVGLIAGILQLTSR